MNPKSTVHELERMKKELHQYRESYPGFYHDMMHHINNMSIRLLLEGKLIKNLPLEQLDTLVKMIRYTKRMM